MELLNQTAFSPCERACDSTCNSQETYSTIFAQSGGRLSVINTQLAMIVHMITTLNNVQAVVKEAAYVIGELTFLFCLFLIHHISHQAAL